MKTNRSLIILSSCLAVLITGVFLIREFCPSVSKPISSNSRISAVVSNQPTSVGIANVALVEQQTNVATKTAGRVDGFFKTIINRESGQYAIVNSNKSAVILKNRLGDIVWSTDVIASMGSGWPEMWGERKINSMKVFGNELVVGVGRATVGIDIRTGKITGGGVD